MGFKVKNAADLTTIYVYDVISDEFGVSAAEFAAAIDGATSPVEIRINSPGGDAWAGKAMAEAIKAASVPITAYADGLVASAATLLAIAADKFLMRSGTNFVIHKAWTATVGDDDAHIQSTKALQAGNEFLLQAYEEKTGTGREQLTSWLKDETWFGPEEAQRAGFADGGVAEVGLAAFIPPGYHFSNIPESVAVVASCDDAWFGGNSRKPTAKECQLRRNVVMGVAGALSGA